MQERKASMKRNTLAKKVVSFILVFAMALSISMMLTACGGGEEKYKCGYCGYGMEVPYTYIGGKATCWKCAKTLRGG